MDAARRALYIAASHAAAPMRLPLLLTLLVLVPFSGCRDSLVSDAPPVAPPPSNDLAPLYIKGIQAYLALGDQALIRMERHPEAASYAWSFAGEGTVERGTSTFERDLYIRAVAPGEVVAEAYAYDADGRLLAIGSETFEVVH